MNTTANSQPVSKVFKKSPILNFYELTEEQRANLTTGEDQERINDIEENNYVLCPLDGEPLPLSMFIRNKEGRYNGFYGMSYFSAYGIILGRTGEDCIISYLTW